VPDAGGSARKIELLRDARSQGLRTVWKTQQADAEAVNRWALSERIGGHFFESPVGALRSGDGVAMFFSPKLGDRFVVDVGPSRAH
jgi:hypothetical protein